MKRSVTKEKNQTKQVDNIYNHKRKKKKQTCTTLMAGVTSIFPKIFFFPFFGGVNHFVTTRGKSGGIWSKRGKGGM